MGHSTGCLADLFSFLPCILLISIQRRSSEIIGLFRGNTDDYFHVLYLPHQAGSIRTFQNNRKVPRAQVYPRFFPMARELTHWPTRVTGLEFSESSLVSQNILFPQKRGLEKYYMSSLDSPGSLVLKRELYVYGISRAHLSTALPFIPHVILSNHFISLSQSRHLLYQAHQYQYRQWCSP